MPKQNAHFVLVDGDKRPDRSELRVGADADIGGPDNEEGERASLLTSRLEPGRPVDHRGGRAEFRVGMPFANMGYQTARPSPCCIRKGLVTGWRSPEPCRGPTVAVLRSGSVDDMKIAATIAPQQKPTDLVSKGCGFCDGLDAAQHHVFDKDVAGAETQVTGPWQAGQSGSMGQFRSFGGAVCSRSSTRVRTRGPGMSGAAAHSRAA